MGLIKLSRAISVPVKNIARAMTRQHSQIAGRFSPHSLGTPPAPPDGSALAAGASDLEIDDQGLWFPDDCLPSETCSTYAGEIDVSELTSGILPRLFTNPISVTTVSLQIARQSIARDEFGIVNVGVTVIYVGFGFPPTSTNYSYSLNACSSANDGTGGILINRSFNGDLYIIASSASGGAVNFNEIFRTVGLQQ